MKLKLANPSGIAAAVLLALGLSLLALAAARGQLSFGFLFVVPFLYGQGPLAALGGLTLMLGLILTFSYKLTAFSNNPGRLGVDDNDNANNRNHRAKPGLRHGGVLFIGPLPILWGSDSSMAKPALALGLGLLTLLLILSFFIG